MDKATYKRCISEEVYKPYLSTKKRLCLFDKIWCKHLSPELNAVYLVRKKQYLESGSIIKRTISRFYHIKLMRRYGIHITEGAEIGIGLRIAHPTSVVITSCKIGENFTIYQNCTIGQKAHNTGLFPTIGNNVTMYSGSSVIGKVKVADNVVLGANSLLLHDADKSGIYVGSPARLLKETDDPTGGNS